MKKLMRILPFVATVWVAMYVSKETGEINWESEQRWATKKQCMTAAKRTAKETSKKDYYTLAGTRDVSYGVYGNIKADLNIPVCYRLTKYSTR